MVPNEIQICSIAVKESLQVKADLNFQLLKVKFLLKSSVLPQND